MSKYMHLIGVEELARLRENHAELLAALQAIELGFSDGSIKFTKQRRSDSDPYHPANTLLCAALANAVAIEDDARMSVGFGEALALTRKAVSP